MNRSNHELIFTLIKNSECSKHVLYKNVAYMICNLNLRLYTSLDSNIADGHPEVKLLQVQ